MSPGDVYRVLPPDYPRTVRLLSVEPDGRWLVQNVHTGVKTRVSTTTLAKRWARVALADDVRS